MRGGDKWGIGEGTRRKTFSLLLLKEKGATVGEGAPIEKVEMAERKNRLTFPFNADGKRWDAS